jgi:hypothetical protein
LIGTALWAAAGASVDFETWNRTFTLIVQATNAANATDTALLYISITILNVNDAPVITSAGAVAVPENTPNGTVVYTLTFTDQDVSDSHTVALRDPNGPSNSNNGSPAFRFEPLSRTLRVNSLLNFEAGPTLYVLNLTVTDAGSPDYPAITSFILLTVTITGKRSRLCEPRLWLFPAQPTVPFVLLLNCPDANDPPLLSSPPNCSVNENTPVGSVVYNLTR